MHKLSVGFTPKPVFKSRMRLGVLSDKDIVAGNKFKAQFTVRNTGGEDFPGGEINFTYNIVGRSYDYQVIIPPIPRGEQKSTSEVELKALEGDHAYILCDVKARDGQDTDCTELDNPIAPLVQYKGHGTDKAEDRSQPRYMLHITSREEIGSRRRQKIIIVVALATLIVTLLLIL